MLMNQIWGFFSTSAMEANTELTNWPMLCFSEWISVGLRTNRMATSSSSAPKMPKPVMMVRQSQLARAKSKPA